MRLRSIALVLFLVGGTCLPAYAQEQTSELESIEAVIQDVKPSACPRGMEGCLSLDLLALTGSMSGSLFSVDTDAQSFVGGKIPKLTKGMSIIVETQKINGRQEYVYSDIMRTNALVLLAVLFLALAFLVGRMKVLRSVFGMLASLAVLFLFTLPRILNGEPPLQVALISSFVIMALTFSITHGFNVKMWSAFFGTCLSLLLTAGMAMLFSQWAMLMGLADEHAVFLLNNLPQLDTKGLLLAGIIIGTLGSLDDVTISQASAVFELRIANPKLKFKELYRRSLRIGQDHIAGAINTLVLAYAGAALPLLLLVVSSANQEPFGILMSREMFATEIVRTLVGSMGLLAAIPFTNLFATMFASNTPATKLEKMLGHSHHS